MLHNFNTRSPSDRRFDVMKREKDGHVHRVGVTYASDNYLANTKAHRIFGPNCWAVESERATND